MEQIRDVKIQQQILLEGLNHLDRVCRQEGLTYFLCNGSLLGAVKYGRFIPWDDDVDVLMPREDYDRLMKLPGIDNADFTLLSRERDPRWKVPYAKLSHNHTLQKETTADFGCENGISVDVFPVDPWCGGRKGAKLQAAWCGLLRRFMSASLEETFFSPRTGWKRAILYGIWVFSRACGTPFFVKLVDRQRIRGAKKPGDYLGCLVWAGYGAAEIMPREQFAEQSHVRFCGGSYPTFHDPDGYLTSLYGDYHQELPPERQKSNHALWVYFRG